MLALTVTPRTPADAMVHLVRKEQYESTFAVCGDGFYDREVVVDYMAWDDLPAERRCARCAGQQPRFTKAG